MKRTDKLEPLLWPDGKRRGWDAGEPPKKSMTLQDELSKILGPITETMIANHIAAVRAAR
jgi:hypothetical protein